MRSTLSFLGLLSLASAQLSAQPFPLDVEESQVNSDTAGDQRASGLTRESDGSFVVTWFDGLQLAARGEERLTCDENDSHAVHARVFRRGGHPSAAAEFQVNTYSTGYQADSQIASLGLGRFVVVWFSEGSWGGDSDSVSIQARRFDEAGRALEEREFQVNAYTTGGQSAPEVAASDEGGFVVAWMSAGSPGNDDDSYSIQARRFGADGSPLDPVEFQVNVYTTYIQAGPSIAIAPSGDFVVTWSSPFPGEDYSRIQARRFSAAGTPLDPVEFQVDTYAPTRQANPQVAMAPTGDFVVVWQSDFGPGPDAGTGVYARRFSADGQALDPVEFLVNVFTPWGQFNPDVAMNAAGDFVIVWTSGPSAGSDQDGSIQGRRFRADGTPIDALEFPINTYMTGEQIFPRVAGGLDGDFVVTWTSDGSFGSDISGTSVQARRFGRPTIEVTSTSGGTGGPGCTLRDALTAASTGVSVGDCPPGNEGAVVELPPGSSIELYEADNGDNGLPIVDRLVTVRGQGSRIERDPGLGCPVGPEFRLFEVSPRGVLGLDQVAIANGCAPGPGGGALVSGGTLLLTETSIEGNEAVGPGGGIAVGSGSLVLSASTVRGNLSDEGGGGIALAGDASRIRIERSTIAENLAATGGGLDIANSGPVRLRNSTIAANRATVRGGGLAVEASAAEVWLEFSTLSGNEAPLAAGIDLGLGALTAHGSLVGENEVGADCAAAAGILAASGANLDTDGSCAALAGGGFATVGSFGLGPLADNGGPTRSHLPSAGSPALDAAPACVTAAGAPLATDQRGYPRPTDDDGDGDPECDLGAVERGPLFLDGFEIGDLRRWSVARG